LGGGVIFGIKTNLISQRPQGADAYGVSQYVVYEVNTSSNAAPE
jgi:hypothetical protein